MPTECLALSQYTHDWKTVYDSGSPQTKTTKDRTDEKMVARHWEGTKGELTSCCVPSSGRVQNWDAHKGKWSPHCTGTTVSTYPAPNRQPCYYGSKGMRKGFWQGWYKPSKARETWRHAHPAQDCRHLGAVTHSEAIASTRQILGGGLPSMLARGSQSTGPPAGRPPPLQIAGESAHRSDSPS